MRPLRIPLSPEWHNELFVSRCGTAGAMKANAFVTASFLSSSLGTCPFGGTNMALSQGDIPWLQGGPEMPMKAAIRGQSTYLWPLRSRWLHNEQGFTESYGKITMDVPHCFSLCMTFHQPMCLWLFVLPRCDSSVISYMTLLRGMECSCPTISL